MNTVLYTRDLEPITVLDMPVWLQDAIERSGAGRIAVAGRGKREQMERGELYMEEPPPTMLIELKLLRDENGDTHKFFTTKDEELALGLVPKQLPGQLQMYQYMTRVIEKQRDVINKLK
jgi:hypothetical protein